jgi:hypothetical protein
MRIKLNAWIFVGKGLLCRGIDQQAVLYPENDPQGQLRATANNESL